MYVNGNGFRAIERQTGVNHNRVIQWLKKAALTLANAPQPSEIPEVTQIDELETFVAKKKQDLDMDSSQEKLNGYFSAVILGDRSAQTFEQLWKIVRCWHSDF